MNNHFFAGSAGAGVAAGAGAASAGAGAGAGAATGAGAGAGAGVSFLPQAARATAAKSVARIVVFMCVSFKKNIYTANMISIKKATEIAFLGLLSYKAFPAP